MGKKYMKKKYPLDMSGAIHLASMTKKYSNFFRISLTLNEEIVPEKLQVAFDRVAPRFPTIVAGVRTGFFNFYLKPVEKTPAVKYDEEVLPVMSKKMIRECAMQVLYKENKLSIEVFHTLTDGTGGKVFLYSLLAEYLKLTHDLNISYTDGILNPNEVVKEEEVVDDYVTYAGKKGTTTNRKSAFQLPNLKIKKDTEKKHIISKSLHIQDVLEAAKKNGVSLTAFMTAVMADSILQIQKKHDKKNKPVQIMVPVNLRSRFESSTLYNFSLCVLAKVKQTERNKGFEKFAKGLAEQIKKQSSADNLRGLMTMNTKTQKSIFFKMQPLPIKMALWKLVYALYGERNSCISISNMGEFVFPKEVEPFVKKVDCILTPRRNSPYNFGVVSYNGKLHINISRNGSGCGLEEVFYQKLEERCYT